MRGAQTMGSPGKAPGLATESRQVSTSHQPWEEPLALHRCLLASEPKLAGPRIFLEVKASGEPRS